MLQVYKKHSWQFPNFCPFETVPLCVAVKAIKPVILSQIFFEKDARQLYKVHLSVDVIGKDKKVKSQM